MSLNDTDVTLGGSKGVDMHPGIANPTSSSTHANPMAANFVSVPTRVTESPKSTRLTNALR